ERSLPELRRSPSVGAPASPWAHIALTPGASRKSIAVGAKSRPGAASRRCFPCNRGRRPPRLASTSGAIQPTSDRGSLSPSASPEPSQLRRLLFLLLRGLGPEGLPEARRGRGHGLLRAREL